MQIGNDRIITQLTEIAYKKEITGPYLLHLCAAEEMSESCVSVIYGDVINLCLQMVRQKRLSSRVVELGKVEF